MPSLTPGATGVIEMERAVSRVEPFLPEPSNLDCAGELARLAQGQRRPDPDHESDADHILFADFDRLAEELEAEYAALRTTIASARRLEPN